MARLEKELVSVRRGVKKNLSLNRENFRALRPGLKQLYRDGRQRLARANKTRTIDDLHEWRKQVKSLMYVVRVLSPVWPPMATTLTEQLEQLGNYLSDDHDLAMLRETLKQYGENQEEDITEIEALLALIDRRRAELETESESLGKRIFVEKPSAFVTRFGDYWARWRSERRLGSPALAGSPNLNPKAQ